jgi:hypothetical protein
MSFTQYIKDLEPSDCPPKLLDELAKALGAEMNRYGLLNQPPYRIGYDHWESWWSKLKFGLLPLT